MKLKMLLALAMLLVLLTAGSIPAAADGATVPFKAFYAMSPQIVGVDQQGCFIQKLPGIGEATHLGESTFYSGAKSCPGTWIQSGDGTWTAANGDKLYGGFLGTFELVETPDGLRAYFEGTYYMDEGDGRFAGYTGEGAYWGTALGGVGELYFEGTLTKPEKP
jgi:hypothetical protein